MRRRGLFMTKPADAALAAPILLILFPRLLLLLLLLLLARLRAASTAKIVPARHRPTPIPIPNMSEPPGRICAAPLSAALPACAPLPPPDPWDGVGDEKERDALVEARVMGEEGVGLAGLVA